MSDSRVVVRRLRPGDLEDLRRIYNHYITQTHITFDTIPRTEEEQQAWGETFADSGPVQCFVAEEDGVIIGYAGSAPLRPRPAYRTSVETSIYLAPGHEGRGGGGMLYQTLFEALDNADLHRAYAAIARPNERSEAFHHRFGFRPMGVYGEVGWKFGRFWDVAIMEKPL